METIITNMGLIKEPEPGRLYYKAQKDEAVIHHDDISLPQGPLDELLHDTDIRIVPGAQIVASLYARQVEALSPGETLPAMRYIFKQPTLWARTESGLHVLKSLDGDPKHGNIIGLPQKTMKKIHAPEAVAAALFRKIGKEYEIIAQHNNFQGEDPLYIVTNISVGCWLPKGLARRAKDSANGLEHRRYKFGEIGFRKTTVQQFCDKFAPYFKLEIGPRI